MDHSPRFDDHPAPVAEQRGYQQRGHQADSGAMYQYSE